MQSSKSACVAYQVPMKPTNQPKPYYQTKSPHNTQGRSMTAEGIHMGIQTLTDTNCNKVMDIR